MNWLVLSLLTPGLFAITNFIEKFLIDIKQVPAIRLTVLICLGTGLLGMLFGVFVGIHQASLLDATFMIVAGLLVATYVWPYFIALKLDETSRIIPLFQLAPVVLVGSTWIVLGEKLTVLQGMGALVIILGGFILCIERSVLGVFQLRPAFWLMISSSILYAMSGLFIRMVVSQGDFGSALFFEGLGTFIGGLVALKISMRSPAGLLRESKLALGLMGVDFILSYLAIFCEIWAMSMVEANRVRTIQGIQPLFVVILGASLTVFLPKIYHENLEMRALLLKGGVGLSMVLGVGLLYWK